MTNVYCLFFFDCVLHWQARVLGLSSILVAAGHLFHFSVLNLEGCFLFHTCSNNLRERKFALIFHALQ